MTPHDPSTPGWVLEDGEARALGVTWLLIPYAAAAFFFGAAADGAWWTLPSALGAAACVIVGRWVINRAGKRRAEGRWRGGSSWQDIEIAKAAMAQLGWSDRAWSSWVRWLGWALFVGGALASARAAFG